MTSLNVDTKNESHNEDVTTIKFDIFEHLPPEIAQNILFQLSPEDLRTATSCCLSWKAHVSNNDYFWKKMCEREGYLDEMKLRRSEFCNDFLKKYTNDWEGMYWYNHSLQQNWESNNYKEYTYPIKRPHDDYTEWLFLNDLFAILSFCRTELYVYNCLEITEPINFSITDIIMILLL